MTNTLYQLTDKYLQVLDNIDEYEDDNIFQTALDSLTGELENKAVNVAMYIRNIESTAEAIKQAELQMENRRKLLESKIDRIKQYLLDNMQKTGIQKIECPYFKIAIRQNPESLIVDPLAQIPDEYYKQPPPPAKVLDKATLKKDIQQGLIVDGCKLERKLRVEIK